MRSTKTYIDEDSVEEAFFVFALNKNETLNVSEVSVHGQSSLIIFYYFCVPCLWYLKAFCHMEP